MRGEARRCEVISVRVDGLDGGVGQSHRDRRAVISAAAHSGRRSWPPPVTDKYDNKQAYMYMGTMKAPQTVI